MKDDNSNLLDMMNQISKVYWGRMWDIIDKADKPDSFYKAFLHNPEELRVTLSGTHLIIEYIGEISKDELDRNFQVNIEFFDYSNRDQFDLLEYVSGIESDSTSEVITPLSGVLEGLVIPTNRGLDKLIELHWNYDSLIELVSINGKFTIESGKFARLVNCVFFDEHHDYLITRRVKWVDFIPLIIDRESDEIYDRIHFDLSQYKDKFLEDIFYQFPLPVGFKDERIERLNRFIELVGSDNISETDITSFLYKSDFQFILSMSFGAKRIHSEISCEWQSEKKDAIRPDFFITKPNGFSDIVEFKLPHLKSKKTIVGKNNRETFSAEINSYISQTRVYKKYFEDPNNYNWVYEKYGIKVKSPRRILVIGRRHDFSTEDWKDIETEYNNFEIFTYDDIIDGVMTQFYF